MKVRRRSGFTLPELLIAIACAAALFAVIGALALRQQRLFAELASDAAITGRVREIAATLPIDLRAVSPGAGDIREARDTSLEIRSTIASAVVCDTAGRSVLLGPAHPGADTYAASLTSAAAGDTAWLLDVGDTLERWVPARITSISSATVTTCAPGGPLSTQTYVATALALDTPAVRAGTVLRITRPVRYSLYKSADGSWQAGARDWNASLLRFNTIQPVAGPLLPPPEHGLFFSYLDTNGAVIEKPAESLSAVSLIRIASRAQAKGPARVLGAGGAGGAGGTLARAESLDVAVFLHNRP